MRLRRSLALAAASAALAPAVLLVAPVAHASDGSPSPTAGETETTTTDGTTTPDPTDTTPAAADTTPAGVDESTPAAADTTPAASAPASSSASASASASASTSASASPSPSGPVECDDENPKFDENLQTSLSGLPSKIVAGSGFHGFKLNVKNSGSHAYQRVDLGVFAAQVDEDDFFVDTSHLTLQYKDPDTGKWTGISLDGEDEGAGYLGYTDIKAKESFSIDLRLAVDAKAPAGLGFAISIGMYADDEGNCVASGDDSYYEFEILQAGSVPGDVDDSKPQGGSKPLPAKPAGDKQIDLTGRLASTGSSSALPTIALVGGAAVAVGAGAVFVVRRRRTAGPDATV
ncbi:LPXTG cell wall anchor domain-containing protein [Streptomyces sp. NPDC004012]